MVITASQISAFFEDEAQMGFSNSTQFDSLNAEGITLMNDLAEWEDDYWDQLMSNYKKPDRIPDIINADQLIHQVTFPLSVNYFKILKIASRMVHYYDSILVDLTAPRLRWMVLDNFKIQRKAMEKTQSVKSRCYQAWKDHYCCQME